MSASPSPKGEPPRWWQTPAMQVLLGLVITAALAFLLIQGTCYMMMR
jgi:hypothetical protein